MATPIWEREKVEGSVYTEAYLHSDDPFGPRMPAPRPFQLYLFDGDEGFTLRHIEQFYFHARGQDEMWGKVRKGRSLRFSYRHGYLRIYAVQLVKGGGKVVFDLSRNPGEAIRQLYSMCHDVGAHQNVVDYVERWAIRRVRKWDEHFVPLSSEDNLENLITHSAYPLLRLMNDPTPFVGQWDSQIPEHVSPLLRSRSIGEATVRLYGKRGATKAHRRSLAAALQGQHFKQIALSQLAKPLIPRDWHCDLLIAGNANHSYRTWIPRPTGTHDPRRHIREAREWLGQFNERRIMKFLTEDITLGGDLLEGCIYVDADLRREGIVVPLTRFTSLEDMHEALNREAERMRAARAAEYERIRRMTAEERARLRLEQDKHLEEAVVDQDPYNGIDGYVEDDLTFVTPKAPADLIRWGVTMDHCIGSYANDAMTGNALFVAVMRGDKMIATAMFRNGYLLQMYGFKNAMIEEKLQQKILVVFNNHKLTKRR